MRELVRGLARALPGTDGQLICRELRQQSDIPVIVLTSRVTLSLIHICGGYRRAHERPFARGR